VRNSPCLNLLAHRSLPSCKSCPALCARAAAHPPAPLPLPPAPMSSTPRRPRPSDTSRHVCPPAGGAYRGWRGLGHLRAPGPPSGGPGRQVHGTSGPGSLLATHGPLGHGQQAAVALPGRGGAGLAQGWGSRAPARGFAVAPHTGLHWLAEAAAPLRALSAYVLCALPPEPRQLDE
jgi:hypothetical protein